MNDDRGSRPWAVVEPTTRNFTGLPYLADSLDVCVLDSVDGWLL